MSKKEQMQEQFGEVLRGLADAAREIYGSNSFSAGYMQALAVQLFDSLTAKQQKQWLEDMKTAALKKQAEAIRVQSENRSFDRV